MLRFMSVRNLLSGNLIGRLEGDGLSFNSAKATATIDQGRVKIKALNTMVTLSASMPTAQSTCPAINLKVVAKLAVFDTVGKVMKVVPIVGKAADAVSSLYFTVDGCVG